MDRATNSAPDRRRSERIPMAFAIEASGVDHTGEPFLEKTNTITVSRFGCCLSLPRVLRRRQRIYLNRVGVGSRHPGHIVARMGSHAEGFLYGVSLPSSAEALWNIQFSSSFHERILDNLYDGVYFVNRERRITYWNAGAEGLTGYKAAEVIGHRCFDNLLMHVDEAGNALCTAGCPLKSVMTDGEPRQADIYLRHKQGHRVPVNVRILPMRGAAGEIIGAVEVFSDATAKNCAEKRASELETLAYRDALTNLPNRRYLEMKVEQALQEHREFGRQFGLVLFDLDRFKQVNDRHGHNVGDALLQQVAQTLEHNLRPRDTIGRWGGEEFLVLMPDVVATALGDLADRCRFLIAKSSVRWEGLCVSTTASIGATLLSHKDSPAGAIGRVDELMYESKRSGGDRTTIG